MKPILLILAVMLFPLFSFGQDAKAILEQSYQKCQSVQNGYYEMDIFKKYMSGKDTVATSFKCHFKKLEEDTLYSSAFHYAAFYEGKYSGDVLYTGDDFVTYSMNDSSGRIMSKVLWAEQIKSFRHNYTFYSPLTNSDSNPMSDIDDLNDENYGFHFIGEEKFGEIETYHIQVDVPVENDSTQMIVVTRSEMHFWINRADFIPIQFTVAFDLVMNGDTMYQHTRSVLKSYELNNLKDIEVLTMASIPSYVLLKDYVPHKSPELLPVDTIAPDWELPSLTEENIRLSDQKGKIVLIDFFYKACYPCMQALPGLQRLHEKYGGKGFRVIGIDPYDTKEKDEIDVFLAKRGVTYTVVLGGKDVAMDYHVSGYPTMYLVDEDGKILFSQVGYGDGTEEKLEEVIKANLR